MSSAFVLSQILVGIAAICDLISFQCKKRESILLWLAISSTLISSHFFLLGNFTAGGCSLITSFRMLTAYFSKARWWIVVFSALSILVFGLTYQNSINMLPLMASILGVFGVFQSSDKVLRKCIMAATLTWVIHNALIGSPAAFLLEAMFLAGNLIGYWRFHWRQPSVSAEACKHFSRSCE